MNENKFPEFDENEAKKASNEAIIKHENHAKQYNPGNILNKCESFDQALKREEERLQKESNPFF